MNLITFLLAIFIVQVNTFAPKLWEENVRNFVEEAKGLIEKYSKDDKNCSDLGLQQLDQQKRQIFKEFSDCGLSQNCYYDEENIFHQRVEDIKAEVALCGQNVCKDAWNMEKLKTSIDLTNTIPVEGQLKIVIDLACNCSFLTWASLAAELRNEKTGNWINETSNKHCLIQVGTAVGEVMYQTFEGFRRCKKTNVDNLKSHISKNYNWNNLSEGMQKIDSCSREHFVDLRTKLEEQTDTFHICAPLTDADYKNMPY